MDDVTKQAVLSAIRSLLAVAGGALATHGLISSDAANEAIGALMVIIPVVWGVWDKYHAEVKTQTRIAEALKGQ